MGKLIAGDIVSRKSYGSDVIFKVTRVYCNSCGMEVAELKGLDVRLAADAPVEDLEKMSPEQVQAYRNEFLKTHSPHLVRVFNQRKEAAPLLMRGETSNPFMISGRILHLDGDAEYMKLCLAAYKKLNLQAWGYAVPEEKQPLVVVELIKQHLPDILVLTGHDGVLKGDVDLKDLKSYRNSRYFVEGVKKARQFEIGADSLFIFAGACQSHYEALIEAKANYASAPGRVLIHALDPVLVVEKVAFTSFRETVGVRELVGNTITGPKGIGGTESQGKSRTSWPKPEVGSSGSDSPKLVNTTKAPRSYEN